MFHTFTHLHPAGILATMTVVLAFLIFFTVWYRRRQRSLGTLAPAPRKADALFLTDMFYTAFYTLNGVYLICVMFHVM